MITPDVLLALMRLDSSAVIWTGLHDRPGLFLSDTGRVASIRLGKPRLLTGGLAGIGYQAVGNPRTSDRFYVHQMMCEVFHGPRPTGMVVRHLDGNRLNNDCGNLTWGTPAENSEDARRHGTTAAGEKNFNAKLTRQQVAEMRWQRTLLGTSHRQLAKQFGVTTMTAWRATEGVSWK